MDKTTLSDQLKNLFESLDPNKDSNQIVYDLFEDDGGYNNIKKPAAPRAMFYDDPLALSCASYRIYKNEPARRFTNIEIVKATQEDRDQAQAIRDYYNQRYTMRALKGQQLTEYQQKTAQFLSGLHHLTNDELGLLYKLPYFYDEDCAFEQVTEQTASVEYKHPYRSVITDYQLTPVVEIFKSRKGGELCCFFYRDQNGQGVKISCRSSDSIAYMLRSLFNQPTIHVRGHTALEGIDTVESHYVRRLTQWELVF